MTRNKYSIRFRDNFVLIISLMIVKLSVSGAAFTSTTTNVPSIASKTSTSRYNNPLVEHKNERNCKALCEHCGCLGFYCGEECICECNDDKSDTECIQTMQANARTLNTPFEILIQGPSSNCFVRNAQQFEQKHELTVRSAAISKAARNRRCTITIYKPPLLGIKKAPLAFNALKPILLNAKISQLVRPKRSVDHLEWFNDFANTLVRPAPFGVRAQKQREEKTAYFKRQATTAAPLLKSQHEPWFLEQAIPRLIRPAPLQRHQQLSQESTNKGWTRKSSRNLSMEQLETRTQAPKPKPEVRPLRDALQVVERIPRVLQDTVTHLAADNNGDVFSLNIMDDVLPKSIERNQKKRTQRRLSKKSKEDAVVPTGVKLAGAPLVTPQTPLSPRGLFFPWLRQQRLKRLGLYN